MDSSDRLIRLKEVCTLTGLSRTSIYKLVKQAKFPPSVKLGPSVTAWLMSEVQAWIDARVNADDRLPWTPPPAPARKVEPQKLPALVPNEKGAEAAAKIAGVVGIMTEAEQAIPDCDIALRFPDWPAIMRRRTAAAYLDLSESAFIREVYRGVLPYLAKLGGRESWSREELDGAIAALLARKPR